MKTTIFSLLLLIGFTVLLALSCTKASEDKLVVTPPPGGGNCDTVGMKYTTDILPIMQARCYGCHGNGNTGGSGGINLDGYENLKPYVDNGQVAGNITHATGFVGMPYGEPKMDDCTINKMLDWINSGAQNN